MTIAQPNFSLPCQQGSVWHKFQWHH